MEILVSESQERMLLVPWRDRLGELLALLDRYGVEYSVIGYFTGDGRARFLYRGIPVVDIPVELAVNPPEPERRAEPPEKLEWELPRVDGDVGETLLKIVSSPRAACKRPIYESYDWGVGGRTVLPPGYADAAVIWLRDGTSRGFAAALAGNPRYTRLDPFRGAALSALEAYRRLAAVGAEPLALLDNVNSGNPEKPRQYWYTVEMVRGLAWAAKSLGLPVIGGNVSLYNEDSEGRMVDPVTTVLALGRIEDVGRALPSAYHGKGLLVLAGATRPELGGSEAVEAVFGEARGRPPEPRPGEEKRLAKLAIEASRRRLVLAAHSVGIGGVAVAAAKMALRGGSGIAIDLSRVCSNCTAFEAAFSETPARILFEVIEERLGELESLAESLGVPVTVIGQASENIELKWGSKILASYSVDLLRERWLEGLMALRG